MMRRIGLVLLCGLGAVACHRPLPVGGPPPGLSWSTTPHAKEPQRVVILPPWLGDGVAKIAIKAGDNLAAAWREQGLHQVLVVGQPQRDEVLAQDPVGVNRLQSADLLRIRDRWGVDAVLISRIEQFRGFDPVMIAMTAHLVSTRDGSVLWSATGLFDGRRSEVQDDLEAWWARHHGNSSIPLNGWRQALQSPDLFSRYATWRLAWSVDPSKPDKTGQAPQPVRE